MSLIFFVGLVCAFFYIKNHWSEFQILPPAKPQILPTGENSGNVPILTFADEQGQTILSVTVRELCSHLAIIGQSGSGKTSTICSLTLEALMNAGLPGIVFSTKQDDRLLIEKLAKRTGRELTIIDGSESSASINFIEAVLKLGKKGFVSNLVEILFQLPQTLNRSMSGAGQGEAFWQNSGRLLLSHCLNLIHLTGYPLSIDALTRLLTGLPRNAEDYATPAFIQKSLCAQLLLVAEEMMESDKTTSLSNDQRFNLNAAVHFFKHKYLTIPEVTRGSIEAVLESTLFYLNEGTMRRVFGSKSSFSLEECFIEGGRTILVDFPTVCGQFNRFATGLFRELVKRCVLARDKAKYPAFMYLYADEYQELALPNDHEFFGVCRSNNVINIIAFQTIDSLSDALGQNGKSKANIILGNCAIKCFFKSAAETAKWMAESVGREYKTLINSSHSTSTNDGSSTSSNNQNSTNSNEGKTRGTSTTTQRDYILFPENFMTLGVENGTASSYLLPGKEVATTKQHFLKVTLDQDLG